MNAPAYDRHEPDGRRDGFILPVALVALVLLTMISSAGLYSARNDFRAARAVHDAAAALAAADAGASRTMATWAQWVPVLPPAGSSVVIGWQALPNGSEYRSVVYRSPVEPGDKPPSRVMVRTTGRVRPPGRASRTVVTILDVIEGGSLCCEAGIKVQTKLTVDEGKAGDPLPGIDGTDRYPAGWGAFCPGPLNDIPGAVTSDTTEIELKKFGDIWGAPPIAEDASIDQYDWEDFGAATYTDLVSQADLYFDDDLDVKDDMVQLVVSAGLCDTTTPYNWGSPGDPSGPCGDYFPVIHVAGDLKIEDSGSGQGVLIIDGDLEIKDDFVFYGLVIVLGELKIEDSAQIIGAVMVRGDENGKGKAEIKDTARVSYSSCAVQRAQASLTVSGVMVPVAAGRSWFEVIG